MSDDAVLHSRSGAPVPSPEPFEQVYREHFRFVWRSLRRLGVPEADLPDVVHDVFVVVHRKLTQFDARSKLTTWLYAICLRTASDRRRSSRHTREVLGEHVEATAAEHDASSLVERREALELLDAVLAELPLEQRAVFTCFELDGMSGEEIAELLDIPLGTVWSRLRLARDCFRHSAARLRARERFLARRVGASR
jgi:RNA polymerase sigma-70 factor (ECF subfamily)